MLTMKRALAATFAGAVVEAAAGTIGAVALLVTALGGWCSDNDTPAQCSARGHQADVHAVVGAVFVVPLVFGLVMLAVRAVGGDGVGRLGWARPVALVVLRAVSLGAVLAGWAALLRAAVNRRRPLACKDGV